MEQLPTWVVERNSNKVVRPLTILDFGARLIDNANKAQYSNTPEIIKSYAKLATSLKCLDSVSFIGCSKDEVNCNKKAVYTSYNELINEIQNYLNSHQDKEARFHLRELVMKYGHYRHYAS
ncbi:MAG: hypothetical protein V4677_18370, partial [Bacteroidota bacterium]